MAGLHVIALDLPGHGRSAGSGYADTLGYARDVGAFLDALSITRAIVVGHSMGGAIAQQIALQMPERVAGLVLLGTGSKLPVDPSLPQRITEETASAIDWIVDWAWSDHAPDELKQLSRERLLNTPVAVLRNDYIACQTFDTREQVQNIQAPTLVISAAGDRMVKPKFSITLSEKIPEAAFVSIENAGHMFPLEKPHEVARIIHAWLQERER